MPVVPPPPADPLPPEAPAISAGHAAGGEVAPDFAFDGAALAGELVAPGVLTPDQPQIREIAFVDSRIVGREALSVERDGMLVVVLDAQSDGLAQISAVLAGHEGIQAVHIIAHGASGELQLGSSVLDSAAIDQGGVAAWGKALTEDGDLLLYGCDVAAGESGAEFMTKLAEATGADVAASTDATGPVWLGGDWDLEAATAQIEAPVVVLDDLSFLLANQTGDATDNTLNDDAGSNDTLSGGAGNDIYRFTADFSGPASGQDTVTDSAGTADEINFSAHPGGAVAFNLTFDFGSTLTAAVTVTDTAATTNKVVATGIEKFVGGTGTDTLDFSAIGSNLTFEFAAAGVVTIRLTATPTTFITASNIERIIGGSGNNTYKILAGGSFGGQIVGGSSIASVNTLDYSQYDAGAVVNLDAGRATGFEAVDDAVTEITRVVGSDQADTITDGQVGDTYEGGLGNDTYRFLDNWSGIGADTVTDASGSNILSFAGASSGITVEFLDADSIAVEDGFGSALTVTGTFTQVEGSAGDDTFIAGDLSIVDAEEVIAGTANSVDVQGGEGDDVFKVGSGSDFAGEVDGGDGTDVLDYSAVGGNIVRASSDPNFSGGIVAGSVEFVQHPMNLVDGFATVGGHLVTAIDSTLGAIDFPLIGNVGGDAADGIESFVDYIVTELTDVLLVAYDYDDQTSGQHSSTAELIEEWLISVLTVNFTNEIPYATVGQFGLVAATAQYMEFALLMEGSFLPPDTEVDIDFGGSLPGLGLEVDATIGVTLTYKLRIAFGIDYSTPTSPVFYFDTNGANNTDASDDDELVVELEAYLEHADLEDASNIQATLGFLQFDIWSYDNSDQISLSNDGDPSIYQDDNRSGIKGRFALDLKDPGENVANLDWGAIPDGRLTHKEMRNDEFKLSENVSAKFNAAADVDLFARLSADVLGGGLPAIQLYLHYDQTFIDAEILFNGTNQGTFGGAPEIVIEDLAIDLGSFLSDFLRPIVQEIQVYTEPFIEPIKVLKQDIAFLSSIDFLRNLLDRDKDGEVSILDAMGTILGETKYGPVFAAVEALINVIELINSVPDEGNLLIPFGTFTFGGDARSGQVSAPTTGVPDSAAMKEKIKNSSAKPETKSFLEKLKRDPINGGFSAPILTEPMEILKLLTGDGSANLFFYDFPQIDFDFSFRKSFTLFFPFNMVIDAGFNVQVRMGFGLDATGLVEFIDDLKPGGDDPEFEEIFTKGFFIDDHFVGGVDLPEFLVNAHFILGASVGISGIVEAGIQGGVIGTLAIDLNDVDSNGAAAGGIDYKIRFSELVAMIRTGPLCFLNFDGSLEWLLEAFVWVGLDLGFFGTITLYEETFDLGGGVIFEFSYHCGVTATPDVAHIDGSGNLVLHMGADAHRRNDADVNWTDVDGSADEDYQVIFVAAGTNIADYALDGEPAVAAQDSYIVLYNGTGEIFAKSAVTGNIVVNDAQDGKDVLTVGENVAAGLVFHGGAGNDKVTYSGTGKARVWGDDGDDRITVNASASAVAGPTVVGNAATYDSEIYGGGGKDTLSGRRGTGPDAVNDGDDYIDGGDGNDKITGFGGNDELRGGDESVAITNNKANGDTIDGGDGNDTIYGGTGSDIIKGGKGLDTIYGGDETGQLANGKFLGDSIDGGADNDTIDGGAGADSIKGAAGDDTIAGGAGDDAITGGAGIDTLRGGTGNDTFYWSAGGDQVDALIDGGADADRIIVTGQNIDTAIELKAGGGDVNLVWGSQTLDLDFVEKYALNAGTGDDSFTIRDLAGTSVNEVAMGLGSSVVDETRYDWDGDGTVEEVEGAGPRFLVDGDGNQILVGGQPVFDDYGVLSKVVRVTAFDAFADSVVIESATGDDKFTGNTVTDAITGSTVVNLSRTGTQAIAYSIAQSNQAQDTFRLDSGAGNDSIDMSAVVTKAFATVDLVAGTGDDTVFGTQFADTINSGEGNDKVSGNKGVDVFVDAGGTDTLSEVNHGSPNNVFNAVTGTFTATSTSTSNFNLNTANFDLNGNTLTIAHAVTEAEDISVFEEASLVSGTGANAFTVQNWMKSARLDGGAGSDTYTITFAGSGSGSVTEFDSIHVAGDVDRMFLFGTSGVDRLNFTARNEVDAAHPTINPDLLLTDGSVSALHDNDTQALGDDTVETVNYTQSEALVVRGGDGDDIFVVDDNALTLNVYGEAGNDFFIIGRVTESQEVPPGSGVLVATAVTNGVSSESFFYGDFGEDGSGNEINVAQSGNDNFEVNHNKAPVWLFGNAGDDRFVVNAVLIPGVDNNSNVSGGSGINSIEYLQNAPVNIDGGSGTDTVVVNGTGIGDTFIVAVVLEDDNPDPLITNLVEKQKVIGAGVQVNMKNVEKLEINGAGGNDRIHVFSTLAGLDVLVTGGSGDDTIHIGGEAVAVVIDPPEYTIDPPAYVYDAAPYIERWESVSWSWGGFWYFDWSSWPFAFFMPVITYTWWYPVWVDPAPVTIDPPPQQVNPPAFQFAHAATTQLTGIKGKVTIEGGDLDNAQPVPGTDDADRVIIHNQSGDVADTGTLTTGDNDADAATPDIGLISGLGTGFGIYYKGAEFLDIHLNDGGDDQFTIETSDADSTTTVYAGGGNDAIRVKTASGVLQLDGGDGDDTFQVWSDTERVDGIVGTLRINGGAGDDDVEVRDTANTADSTALLTNSTLTGLSMAGAIEYGPFATQTVTVQYQFQSLVGSPPAISTVQNPQTFTLAYAPIETLLIGTGSGRDLIDVTGTQAATTINTNDGDDTINVSSDGALQSGHLDDVDGALTLDLGAGGNTLNVSDLASTVGDVATISDSEIAGMAPAVIGYGATGGRFSGGVNVLFGKGGDDITLQSTAAGDVTTIDSDEGNDSIVVDAGQAADLIVLRGGLGQDTLDASASSQPIVLFGDDGQETYATAVKSFANLTSVSSLNAGAGDTDTLNGGSATRVIAVGGAGDDIITGGSADDVLIGDDGTASFASEIVTAFGSLGTAGGDDQIDGGEGRNYLIGGIGGDTLTAGGGNDVALGDNGSVAYTATGEITTALSTDLGSGGIDTITLGEGSNVAIGGAAGDVLGQLGTGAGDDVLVGDNATVTWDPATGNVIQFESLGTEGGNDTIAAGEGRNLVLGGAGADGVTGGTGDDLVIGDNGRALFTPAGVVTLFETSAPDSGGGDTIAVGDGRNIVSGGFGGDSIGTLGGDDLIIGDNGRFAFTAGVLTEAVTTDTAAATGGNDTITAGGGHNVVLGGVGNDAITTGDGDDVVIGDNGTARFEPSGQRLSFETGDAALAGDDTIDAGGGDDIVLGGTGADTIQGGTGNDILLGDQGIAQYAGGGLALVFGEPLIGGSDFLDGGTGNDILLGGGAADSMAANLSDDIFTGDSARITFSGGLVTKIELFGEPDLVLQTLFKLYSNGDNGLEGGDVVIVEEDGDEERGADRFVILESDDSRPGRGPGHALPAHALVLSFLRGQHLAQLPQELRNMILELSLGRGTPPAHGSEGFGQGQGGGKPPAEPQSEAAPFSLEAEASTLVLPAAEAKGAVAQQGENELALAAAALSGAALATSGRTVRTFDPSSGRFSERGASVSQESTNVDRLRFVGTGIDW